MSGSGIGSTVWGGGGPTAQDAASAGAPSRPEPELWPRAELVVVGGGARSRDQARDQARARPVHVDGLGYRIKDLTTWWALHLALHPHPDTNAALDS